MNKIIKKKSYKKEFDINESYNNNIKFSISRKFKTDSSISKKKKSLVFFRDRSSI